MPLCTSTRRYIYCCVVVVREDGPNSIWQMLRQNGGKGAGLQLLAQLHSLGGSIRCMTTSSLKCTNAYSSLTDGDKWTIAISAAPNSPTETISLPTIIHLSCSAMFTVFSLSPVGSKQSEKCLASTHSQQLKEILLEREKLTTRARSQRASIRKPLGHRRTSGAVSPDPVVT